MAMRDPNKTYNIFTRKELMALTPNFDWNAYFKLMKAPGFETLNVSQPEVLQERGSRVAQGDHGHLEGIL